MGGPEVPWECHIAHRADSRSGRGGRAHQVFPALLLFHLLVDQVGARYRGAALAKISRLPLLKDWKIILFESSQPPLRQRLHDFVLDARIRFRVLALDIQPDRLSCRGRDGDDLLEGEYFKPP